MSDTIRAALEQAAEAVLRNLSDRKGIGNELDQCDDEVKAEIGRTVASRAIAAFLSGLPIGVLAQGQPNRFVFASADAQLEWIEAVLSAGQDANQ